MHGNVLFTIPMLGFISASEYGSDIDFTGTFSLRDFDQGIYLYN